MCSILLLVSSGKLKNELDEKYLEFASFRHNKVKYAYKFIFVFLSSKNLQISIQLKNDLIIEKRNTQPEYEI